MSKEQKVVSIAVKAARGVVRDCIIEMARKMASRLPEIGFFIFLRDNDALEWWLAVNCTANRALNGDPRHSPRRLEELYPRMIVLDAEIVGHHVEDALRYGPDTLNTRTVVGEYLWRQASNWPWKRFTISVDLFLGFHLIWISEKYARFDRIGFVFYVRHPREIGGEWAILF